MNDQNNKEPAEVRAAEYVRMSTEHQKYSTDNQRDEIRRYAASRGYEIVRSYVDEGKSGLNIGGREGLQALMADVKDGHADFSAILVYDISRWGRFLDSDEGAHYEFVCRHAGIQLVYCAEPFENDGSLGSNIQKMLKRSMAGEFSRELSAKVFAGQCRLIQLGYRQGGPAGFGLRRQMIDEHGDPKELLKHGDRKSLQSDRVILIPGPAEEIATVRWMYQAFVKDGKTEGEIAADLNSRGVLSDLGNPWTWASVHQILTNEKYIGNNVFNRTSCKLKGKRVANRREEWVRAEGVFESIVETAVFHAAQEIVEERSRRFSDQEMLEHLEALWKKHGRLSGIIIDECEGLPSSGAYRSRFGSLVQAYWMIGFDPGRDYRYIEINRRLREMHPGILAETEARIEEIGGRVSRDSRTGLLTVNNEFTVSIVLSRCQTTVAGALRWVIRLDAGLTPDITVAVRLAPDNKGVLDYYLLPAIDVTVSRLRLAEENGVGLDVYRFETLNYLYSLAMRVNLKEIA